MIGSAAATAAGLAILWAAADQLLTGADRIAERLRIAPAVIGVLVIGVGTSLPELTVSALASSRGQTDLATGNLVGSNILNLTLVLGLAGMIAPVTAQARVLRTLGPMAVLATTVFALLLPGGLSRADGTVLGTLLVLALIAQLRLARQDPAALSILEKGIDGRAHSLPREGARTVVGLAGTLAGAQLLVTGAGNLAQALGVAPGVIGFTLVAMGTSLPELVTSVQAQRRGSSDLLVGNLLGSNLVNSLAGGTVIAFATKPGTTTTADIAASLLTAMALTGLLAWVLLAGGRLTRLGAFVLLGVYALVLPMLTG